MDREFIPVGAVVPVAAPPNKPPVGCACVVDVPKLKPVPPPVPELPPVPEPNEKPDMF